jgi:hypothetical protein
MIPIHIRRGVTVLKTGSDTKFGEVSEVGTEWMMVDWRDGTRSAVRLDEYNITWMEWTR